MEILNGIFHEGGLSRSIKVFSKPSTVEVTRLIPSQRLQVESIPLLLFDIMRCKSYVCIAALEE